jgi:hypothetical protein
LPWSTWAMMAILRMDMRETALVQDREPAGKTRPAQPVRCVNLEFVALHINA